MAKRTHSDFGSGSGITVFESKFFNVVLWQCERGIKTTLEIRSVGNEISFDGKVSLRTDAACFKQLTIRETKKMIASLEEDAFVLGQEAKAKEIRDALFLI